MATINVRRVLQGGGAVLQEIILIRARIVQQLASARLSLNAIGRAPATQVPDASMLASGQRFLVVIRAVLVAPSSRLRERLNSLPIARSLIVTRESDNIARMRRWLLQLGEYKDGFEVIGLAVLVLWFVTSALSFQWAPAVDIAIASQHTGQGSGEQLLTAQVVLENKAGPLRVLGYSVFA